MTHRLLRQSTAVFTLMCSTVMAQGPSPTDTREVTAVGCLKQERDIPGRLAGLEGRDRAEHFVLVNTRITAAAAPDTAGGASQAAAPNGSPGASGAGTSGTGSTSMQSSDRPPSDAARPAAGARASGAGGNEARGQTMYRLTGLPDAQLRPLLNTQVEVRASLNTAAMGGAAVRQPGSTMGSEPASTPSASTPPPAGAPGQGQAPSTQADRRGDKPSDVPDLPELRGMTIRGTSGRCQGT